MFIAGNGVYIHIQQEGPQDAPSLLLLHSIGTQSAIWETPAAILSAKLRIIRADLRGHGLSSAPDGPYRIEEMARDMLGVLDALSIAAAHVAGVSIGGMVAQAMAAQAPARLRSLILIDTALAIPPAQQWHDRAALVRREGMENLASVVLPRWVTAAFLDSIEARGLRNMLLRTAPEGYAGAAEAIAAADLTAGAEHLTMPALVLVGSDDIATPLSCAEELCRAIPSARLHIIPEAAHIPTVEQPAAVAEAMLRFIAELPDDGGRIGEHIG